MNKKFLILFILNLFLASAAFAQFPAEFAVGSMNPVPNGPTSASQTAELLVNPAPGTFNSAVPPIFVTASLSNQQYVGVNTTADSAVVMFGAIDNPNINTGSNARPRPVFAPMTEIGNPISSLFSNSQNGDPVGIDTNENYAYNMFTSIQQWAGLAPGNLTPDGKVVPATNARVYMANLTLNFSQPLNNPFIHLVALGAKSSAGNGFATEFTLSPGSGITLEKVTGNDALDVSATEIRNARADSTGVDVFCINNTAACGTVRLIGTNITSVTFLVYVNGDGDDPTTWGDVRYHTGDQWMMGVSIPDAFRLTAASATISGRVVNPNSRGLKAVKLMATDLATGENFYTTPDSSGNYRFEGLPVSNSYLVTIESRYYRFEPNSKVVTLNGDLANIDFTVASPSNAR